MEKEPRFKASVMTSTLAFIARDLGEPALQAILASFDSQAIAGKQFLPSDWLPGTVHRDLLVATARYLESFDDGRLHVRRGRDDQGQRHPAGGSGVRHEGREALQVRRRMEVAP